MKAVLQRAINWETLNRTSIEERATLATQKAQAAHILDAPLTSHLLFYSEVLECDSERLLETYRQVEAAFANRSQKLTILDASSKAWPLKGIESPYEPKFLYACGNLSLLKSPTVAVLGTRTPSKEGKELAIATAQALGKAGVTIIGGLSAGVEALAHRSALAASRPTIAITATELGESYPSTHQELQEEIGKWGLLLTRFAPGAKMQKVDLLLRNRLMGLLTDVLIIVEDRDGGTAVSQATDALSRENSVIIYQKSKVNQSLLWPRKLVASPQVTVVQRPAQLLSVLQQILGPHKKNTADQVASLQLDLFG